VAFQASTGRSASPTAASGPDRGQAGIEAKLNTTDLTALNKSADVDKQDPADLATTWLKDHGF